MKGTPKPKTETSKKMVPWASPTTQPGMSLARAISVGVAGETSSWSKVPASRSRAMDRPVTTSPSMKLSMPMRLGRKNHWNSKLGLNQLRCRMSRLPPPARAACRPSGVCAATSASMTCT